MIWLKTFITIAVIVGFCWALYVVMKRLDEKFCDDDDDQDYYSFN